MERAIRVVNDVKDLSELLSGASVEQVRLVPEGRQLRLEMELTRACPELATVVRRGLFARATTPWIKSRLTLRGVTDTVVQRATDGTPDQIPLLSCEAVPGGYTLTVTSHDGLRLILSLEQLDGHCVDVGQPLHAP